MPFLPVPGAGREWGGAVLLFVAGNLTQVGRMLAARLFLLGLTYGPCGNLLAQLYPVQLRYTGASLSFSLACGPWAATCVVAVVTGLALWAIAARNRPRGLPTPLQGRSAISGTGA